MDILDHSDYCVGSLMVMSVDSESLDAGLLSLFEVFADEQLGSLPELYTINDLLGSADWECDSTNDLGPAQLWHLLDDKSHPWRSAKRRRNKVQ